MLEKEGEELSAAKLALEEEKANLEAENTRFCEEVQTAKKRSQRLTAKVHFLESKQHLQERRVQQLRTQAEQHEECMRDQQEYVEYLQEQVRLHALAGEGCL